MTAAIYTRVSTASRSRYGEALAYDQNPEVQEAPLRRLIVARGWTLARVYSDRISGAEERRPGLAALMADARRGLFEVVLVWRFDRLSRSVRQFLNLVEELRSLGVDLVSHEQSFDSTTPMGRFTLTMFGALAELEREVIRERIRAGIEYARQHGSRSGKPIGRPRRVFDRQKVAELRQQGLSVRQIARRLGVSRGTVFRVNRGLADAPTPSQKPPTGIWDGGAGRSGLAGAAEAVPKGEGFGSPTPKPSATGPREGGLTAKPEVPAGLPAEEVR